MLRPYEYQTTRKAKTPFRKRRLKTLSPDKADPRPLTGSIAGKRATDIEERFARALNSAGLEYRFQVRFSIPHGLPGHKKVVDFVVWSEGLGFPVEVDGQIGHRTSAQRGSDAVREIVLNTVFAKRGLMPLTRVQWFNLATQEMADHAVRRMFRDR